RERPRAPSRRTGDGASIRERTARRRAARSSPHAACPGIRRAHALRDRSTRSPRRTVWETRPVTDVTIRPVSPDQHDAVMHYFDMVAYADNPNWSRCFCMERLVADYQSRTKSQRRQGIATTLLEAALEHLRSRGVTTVEAYPWRGDVDPTRWVWAQYVGPLSMYQKAGFTIGEAIEDFCIVRKQV